MCHSREAAEQIKAQLADWLAPRGLVFNEDKTRIVHAEAGFDFLGFNVRRYPSGKLLIKPSKAAVRRVRNRLREEVRAFAARHPLRCYARSTRSCVAGRPTTARWCPRKCLSPWTATCGSRPIDVHCPGTRRSRS